jgi:phosphonate transport system substrate-binding protein
VYEFIARHVGERLGLPTEVRAGRTYKRVAHEADISFLCGLPYVKLTRWRRPPVEALVAPLLLGPRYAAMPVYFSDVIVGRDSSFRSFADLRGCRWCYNERHSHSGYGIVRHHLVRLGETEGFFGQVVKSGWHERSVRLVASGKVDASAIDSHVLSLLFRDYPRLSRRLRVVAMLGPSTIQPVVASRRLSRALRADLHGVLVEMAQSPTAREHLGRGLIERFVSVSDSHYDDIRGMLQEVETAGFTSLR